MKLKSLYMFKDTSADSAKNRAVIDTQNSTTFIVGVSSIEEGARIAQQFVEEGVGLIELCGGFGYEGTKKVHDVVGDKVPVGMMVHQVWNSSKLYKLLEGEF